MTGKVERAHFRRAAYVYVRQSTMAQVEHNTESLARQYELVDRAAALGWAAGDVVVVDSDLGVSAKSTEGREGFARLVADVGLGKVGIVLGIEVSRLARRNADWYQLLDLCALTNTLIADADGVYHPVFITTGYCWVSRARCLRQSCTCCARGCARGPCTRWQGGSCAFLCPPGMTMTIWGKCGSRRMRRSRMRSARCLPTLTSSLAPDR